MASAAAYEAAEAVAYAAARDAAFAEASDAAFAAFAWVASADAASDEFADEREAADAAAGADSDNTVVAAEHAIETVGVEEQVPEPAVAVAAIA